MTTLQNPQPKRPQTKANPDVKSAHSQPQTQANLEVNIQPEPDADQAQSQAQREQVFEWLANLPAQVGDAATRYTPQLKVAAALIAAVILVRLALAVLNAINGIPLMQPLLELVGLGYASWFTFQYMLKAESRSQLWETAKGWKVQFLGES